MHPFARCVVHQALSARWRFTHSVSCLPAALHQVFKAFDEDKNGVIDKDELKVAMETLGATLSDSELSEMFEVGHHHVQLLGKHPPPRLPPCLHRK